MICMLDPVRFTDIGCVSKTCGLFVLSLVTRDLVALGSRRVSQRSHFITSDRRSLWSNNWPHTSHLLHQRSERYGRRGPKSKAQNRTGALV